MLAVPALVLFSLFVVGLFAATAAPAVAHPGSTAWMYTTFAHHGAG